MFKDGQDGRSIVLKAMSDGVHFARELELRGWRNAGGASRWLKPESDAALASEHVVEIIEELSGDDVREAAERYNLEHRERSLTDRIIVMEQGDRDLAVVALKEQLDLAATRTIVRQIALSLEYIHRKGIIHADVSSRPVLLEPVTASFMTPLVGFRLNQVKPLNLLRFGNKWKMIDMDAAVKLGQAITEKSSEQSAPPEAFMRDMRGDVTLRTAHKTFVTPLRAERSFDLWSLGIVLYEVIARRALVVSDRDGSLDQVSRSRIFQWDCRCEPLKNLIFQSGAELSLLLAW